MLVQRISLIRSHTQLSLNLGYFVPFLHIRQVEVVPHRMTADNVSIVNPRMIVIASFMNCVKALQMSISQGHETKIILNDRQHQCLVEEK